jgi:hypothetical protein
MVVGREFSDRIAIEWLDSSRSRQQTLKFKTGSFSSDYHLRITTFSWHYTAIKVSLQLYSQQILLYEL